LIDQCVRHFWDWWLIGTKDAGTWAWDIWDAQDQYVLIAEQGGLAAIVFFILIMVRLYANLGNARRRVATKREEWALWLLGAALFSHLTSFFGINYFDQVRVSLFLLIAAICAFTAPILRGGDREEEEEEPPAPESNDVSGALLQGEHPTAIVSAP
jgi:hypothetical protein